MAIFEINQGKVKRIKPVEFKLEKDLQKLIEQNLETFLIVDSWRQNSLPVIFIPVELIL